MKREGNDKSTVRYDPVTVFCFKLKLDEIPGITKAEGYFQSVSGLTYESEVVPYKEGGVNTTTHQLVGPTKWPNLVLKRGFTAGSFALLRWREAWLNDDSEAPKLKRVSGTVFQLEADLKTVVCKWKFENGWPCKWEGPEYDATRSELAIETLEIAHEGLTFLA